MAEIIDTGGLRLGDLSRDRLIEAIVSAVNSIRNDIGQGGAGKSTPLNLQTITINDIAISKISLNNIYLGSSLEW
jgi:hypothetical protein